MGGQLPSRVPQPPFSHSGPACFAIRSQQSRCACHAGAIAQRAAAAEVYGNLNLKLQRNMVQSLQCNIIHSNFDVNIAGSLVTPRRRTLCSVWDPGDRTHSVPWYPTGTLAICLGGVRNFAWQQFPGNCCNILKLKLYNIL